MALDASGFVRRVQFFAGNASEPTTLKGMLTGLDAAPGATVVMDAGIATAGQSDCGCASRATTTWLSPSCASASSIRRLATEVQSAGDVTIKLQRVPVDGDQGHVLLYCHSPTREEKDRAIDTAKATRPGGRR